MRICSAAQSWTLQGRQSACFVILLFALLYMEFLL